MFFSAQKLLLNLDSIEAVTIDAALSIQSESIGLLGNLYNPPNLTSTGTCTAELTLET